MAASLIEVNIVAYGGKILPSVLTKLLPTAYMQVTDENTINNVAVSGANATIYIPGGPQGGSIQKFIVQETQAEILAAANADTVADLSVTGTLDVTGFTTLGAGVLISRTEVAINATATMADGDMKDGYISSTSAATTTITTRTATQLATELGATAGSTYEFVVDNTAGASTVTIAAGSGVTVGSALTGGDDMDVAASATLGVGVFKLTFFSTTAAVLSRIA